MPDHTYITSSDVAVCDFCCRPGVPIAYQYPCSTTITQDLGFATAVSSDGWGACVECALVVDTKDPAAVAAHVIAMMSGPEADLVRAMPPIYAEILKRITDLYAKTLPELGPKNTDTALPPEGARMIFTVPGDD